MRVIARVACAALCVAPRLAWAAPLSATISVDRGEQADDCPAAAELTRDVERILQRSLRSGTPTDELEVQVHFARNRDRYSADVVFRGPKPGERVLQDRGQSCAALAEAVGVTIALSLDKELASRAANSDGQSTPPTAAETKPAKPGALQPAPSSANDSTAPSTRGMGAPVELRASLEGGAAFGLVANSSVILTEELGLRLEQHFVFEGGFNAVLPASTRYGAGSVRTTLLFASARACYLWGSAFVFGPCASFGLGKLDGVGIGYQTVGAQSLTWTAFGAGAVAEAPVWGRVFWGLAGTLWVPTHGSSFAVQNVGTAWESRPLAGNVALRLGCRIW